MQDVSGTVKSSLDGVNYGIGNILRIDGFWVKGGIGQLRNMKGIYWKGPFRLLAGDHKHVAIVFQRRYLLLQTGRYTAGLEMIMQKGDFHFAYGSLRLVQSSGTKS